MQKNVKGLQQSFFLKYCKTEFRVEGEKESNDYGQGSKK